MNVGPLATPHHRSVSWRRFIRPLQYSLVATLLVVIPANATELRPGNTYPLTLMDVDQHQLSTSDGHVSIITLVTRKDEQKAQAVGDRFPHIYFGDPKHRLITLVNFRQKIFTPFRGMVTAIIRHRLDAEAKDLQKIYTAKHLTRNPRSDVFVVADFDGTIVPQFGVAPTSLEFAVFVFDGRGRLVRRWNDVPSADALAAAINEAR